MAGKASAGWIPNQHGAWAMLAVPIAAGFALRPDRSAHLPILAASCVLGYVAFHATSLWLKSPPSRRHRYRAALATYSAAALVLGTLALAIGGWTPAGWLPVFALLLAPALWLARRRNERAVAGGLLTTGAACLLTLVVAYDSPAAGIAAWPASRAAVTVSLTLFGYFFGTVLHVKSLIRERGNTRLETFSLGWHLAWTAVSVPIWGWFPGWLWAGLFAVATLRAFTLPRLARTRPVRPGTIGSIEIGLSMLALAGALTSAAVLGG